MRGAIKRLGSEAEARNLHAYATAALAGGAFAGDLPSYEKVFGSAASEVEQSDDVIAANIKLWAAQMGVR